MTRLTGWLMKILGGLLAFVGALGLLAAYIGMPAGGLGPAGAVLVGAAIWLLGVGGGLLLLGDLFLVLADYRDTLHQQREIQEEQRDLLARIAEAAEAARPRREHVAALVVVLLATGCATVQPSRLSPAELGQIQVRTYPDSQPRDVIAAVETLFRLADGDDYGIVRFADGSGLRAERRWLLYFILGAVMGQETWTVTVDQQSTVRVEPVAASGATLGMGASAVIQEPAIYSLFWARMDYLLGRGGEWPTCPKWRERHPRTNLDALCWLVNDEQPPAAVVTAPGAPPRP